VKTLAQPEDAARLVRRLRDMRPESPRRWGRMSAHQTVCHLGDSLRMALGRRAVSDISTPAGRSLVKWAALYLPAPWPSWIRTSPELDQEAGGTRPVEFEADVAELEALLRLVAGRTERDVWPRHPVFGPISGAAWLRWGYLHTDHHLRQFGA
jgi:hypothetical protein